MSNYMFKGPFAEHIRNHVSLKQAIGYKYEAEAKHLLRFSCFTEEKYPDASILTKEIVLDWCSKKNYEAQANQCARSSILRSLPCIWKALGLVHISSQKVITRQNNSMPLTSIHQMSCNASSTRQINVTMSVNVHIATLSCRYSSVWFMPVVFVPRKQGF